ncbi:UDP-glucuronic acid decarboxylase family protein [Castellaniella sp.]|uniref:UDP-glucuronic acid decarboxylase family protein n=1 Tax=Castellaniella sp. TaxID=1955812 RepID=UPI002D8013A4|nr:UDP-glucuronic acid decarboxylase family protein [Castellaniella sp.]HET8703957.1 UDP-glucuronic acid decarboxylase family protein [Castellaniella sp.]
MRSAPVLVAGGAGFLGAHLCGRLLDMGCSVVCVDNLDTGSRAAIMALQAHPGFSWIRHDVVDPIPVDGPLSRIYNLACPASPRHYQADPPHTLLTCVDGARNLLDLARRTGARILQASTSEVYGDSLEHPQHESYRGNVNIVGLRSCYDEGKRCAETLFSDYGAWHGVDTKIARIFNTYGPGMALDDGRLVSNLVVQALTGCSMTLYGDGSQTRSLCYVDDLIEGLVRLMESPATFRGPVNLGNPSETPVLEVAGVIRELTGTSASVVHLALPPDDPRRRCPDITLAQHHLGWWPVTGLREGLRRTIADFVARIKSA